jgi:hypothetical protein
MRHRHAIPPWTCAWLALFMSVASAETWVCTDSHPSNRAEQQTFTLSLIKDEGILVEQTLGVPRYRILENNKFAIIAEDHYGDFDSVLNTIVVFISTLIIDRGSSQFTYTTAVSGSEVQQRTGQCRQFDEETNFARDDALAQATRRIEK